jgi:23S rRNA (pseudouridine1915-N3)-methyltransferase
VHYRVVYVGRKAADPLCEAAAAYQKRLARYVPCDAVQIREVGDRRDQGIKIMAQLTRDAPSTWVALDERGQAPTTRELAAELAAWQTAGLRHITFVIGGADGLEPSVLEAAPRRWALSKLTLPHRLARLLLTEQLYRAHTLLRGLPYHRD